jgi:hypothetical protein
MSLGDNLGKGLPAAGSGYIVTGNLDEDSLDSATIGAIKIAHEFGHLDDFQDMGKSFQEQQQIKDAFNQRANQPMPPAQRANDPTLNQLDQKFKDKFGVTIYEEDSNEESRADIRAIPTIRQLYGSIPSAAQKAVNKFQASKKPK